jgi:general secretion pathway protein H
MNDRRPGNCGFTLIELTLVVLLIGIASGLVVGKFYGSTDQVRLKASARDLAASLRYSRSHAIAEKRPYVILIGKSGYSVFTSVRAPFGGYEPRQVLKRTLAAGVSVDLPEGDEWRIDFYPLGDSTGGQVKLVGKSGARLFVTIEPITGRTRIVG